MYSLQLSIDELRVIGSALQELPYRLSAPVILRINEQVNPQDANNGAAPVDNKEASQQK